MGVFTALPSLLGLRLLSSSVFDGLMQAPVLVSSSTQLTLSDEGGRVNFFGTGFEYLINSEEILDVTAGTITRITLTDTTGTTLWMDFSGLSVSAAVFQDHLETSNWSAMNALLFSTSDTYNLTNGRDQLRGFGGGDVVNGLGGNDQLFGDQGNDRLNGGAGADSLTGGAGIDTLSGAGGQDVFIFTHAGAANRDILTDFRAADDALRFDNDAFTAFSYTGQLLSADFALGTAAADTSDRFVYKKSTGNLWYDADGSEAGVKVLVAELADGTVLTAADIFIF